MKRVVINICLLSVIIFSLILFGNRQSKSIYINSNNYLEPIIEGDNYLNIDGFGVDIDKEIIYGVPIGTVYSELLDAVDTNGEKAIYSSGGDLLEGNDTIYTADILKIQFDENDVHEYSISVIGDVLGEGAITQNGINAIARQIIDKNVLDDVALFSADYNLDGAVKMNDIMEMIFVILPDVGDDNNNDNPTVLTANFIVQDEDISSVGYESINCTLNIGNDTCQVTAPIIYAEDGYEVVGFSENTNATEADFVGETLVDIDDNKYYYVILRKPISAAVQPVNSNTVGTWPRSITCYAYNGADSCDATFPEVVTKNGYNLVGFSENSSDTETDLVVGSTVTINGSERYYLITSKIVTVTFDKNTTYDHNSVLPSESGYDYRKTNIEADELSFYSTTCMNYNGQGCRIDDFPIIYSAGNEIVGFATAYDSVGVTIATLETIYYLDATLYARVYNEKSQNDYVLGYSEQVGNVVVEFEEGMDANMVMGYVDYIHQLHNDIPELFYMKGKIRMFKKNTYETVYARVGSQYINTAGCTTSVYTGSMVDIKIKNETTVEEYRKGTIVHELSHAFDNYYGTRIRNYNNGKLRQKTDVNGLYNSYLNQSPRPLRDYSYSSVAEFWADSVRWYYSEIFNGFDNEAALLGVDHQPSTAEIRNMVSKYMCIARNNYNEEAVCP